MSWHALIPVKPPEVGKSRLDLPPELRRDLVLAMAADVAAAVAAVADRVSLIGSSPALRSLGLPVLPDAGGGLSRAVQTAAAGIAGPVLVLAGDLPAVTSAELEQLLERGAAVDFGVVADADLDGTVCLLSRRGADLRPAYGPGSFPRHQQAGATALGDVDEWPGLRRDVDRAADLQTALGLGVGAATRAALERHDRSDVHLPAR